MKKAIISLSLILLSTLSYAAWDLEFAVGTFFDNTNAMIQSEYKFALVVDMNNKGFGDDFKLAEGDSFTRGNFINSSSGYKTLITGSLMDADGEGYFFAYSNNSFKFDNDDYGFAGGETVGLVVWNTQNDILNYGDMYTVINPAYTDTASTGSSVNWTISTSNTGRFQWELYNKSVEGDTSDSFFTLSKTVQTGAVPEPSTYAAIFGVIALCLAACRKRK